MPFTVVTLSKVPASLRGDLSKWMQEISGGVYVGNFNSQVREKLWKRICDNISSGEATLSYACRNEIGYNFETLNTKREVIDYDGIPLVSIPKAKDEEHEISKLGFSDAAKFRRINKYAKRMVGRYINSYTIVDIETTGLHEKEDEIIEIGAIKIIEEHREFFHRLIKSKKPIPKYIEEVTGISNEISQSGDDLEDVIGEFVSFVNDRVIIGYNVDFDIKFINEALRKMNKSVLRNECHDLLKDIKTDKHDLSNYKLQTVLEAYGIDKKVPHRALEDAKIIYELSKKVNKFQSYLKEKH